MRQGCAFSERALVAHLVPCTQGPCLGSHWVGSGVSASVMATAQQLGNRRWPGASRDHRLLRVADFDESLLRPGGPASAHRSGPLVLYNRIEAVSARMFPRTSGPAQGGHAEPDRRR